MKRQQFVTIKLIPPVLTKIGFYQNKITRNVFRNNAHIQDEALNKKQSTAKDR